MKNEENKAFRTAFWLLGPLIFYELCTEASAWVCSLFGTQDALLVTGAAVSVCGIPEKTAGGCQRAGCRGGPGTTYRQALVHRPAAAYRTVAVHRPGTVRQIFANGMFFCSPGWHGCLPGPECAPAASFPVV